MITYDIEPLQCIMPVKPRWRPAHGAVRTSKTQSDDSVVCFLVHVRIKPAVHPTSNSILHDTLDVLGFACSI